MGGGGVVDSNGTGLLSDVVRDGEGGNSAGFVKFYDTRYLEGTVEAFSGGEARFLRAVGFLVGDFFSCREARPLVERRLTHMQDGVA